jgi:hypothetical protein
MILLKVAKGMFGWMYNEGWKESITILYSVWMRVTWRRVKYRSNFLVTAWSQKNSEDDITPFYPTLTSNQTQHNKLWVAETIEVGSAL